VPVRYDLWSPYESLINALGKAADQAGCGDIWASPPIGGWLQPSVDGDVELNGYLHLAGWKSRCEPSKLVHILLHAQETIHTDREGLKLLKSSVQVHYYRTDATLLQSVHFDYGKPQAAHPLFHAQVSNVEPRGLSAREAEELRFGFMTGTAGPACYRDARIPTSDMTLASVLLCLAADHLDCDDASDDKRFFREFRAEFLRLHDRLPKPAIPSVLDSLKAQSDHFRSSHWFAHMT
jgi:hypothetical protein